MIPLEFFKLLIVEYINVHTPTTTAIVLSVPFDGWGLLMLPTYVALHQVSQKMRVGCNLPMI